jgi:hypothetical protein
LLENTRYFDCVKIFLFVTYSNAVFLRKKLLIQNEVKVKQALRVPGV